MPRAQSISIAALSLLPFFLIAEDVSERGRGYVGLVYGGKPRAVVVVAENPTRVAQVAAKEFIHFIEKITGQKLSLHVDAMVPRRSRAPRRVLIGESRLTRELGIKSGDFADQEYLIETREKDLILIGRDVQEYGLISYEKNGLWPTAGRRGEGTFFKPMGTLYAVHTFLEKYCGLRW
ncbi:MAG: hypothetical protein QF886_21470, partial [Planctomycetota bacterium]|nr:hypothetical protein [Planctomycetota bacterium]